MKLTSLKINGLHNPVGMAYAHLNISWLVEEAASKYPDSSTIVISKEPDFSQVLLETTGNLDWKGTGVELALEKRTIYYVKVSTTAGGETAEVSGTFETGKMDEPWTAQWIAAEGDYHPIFRKRFSCPAGVSKARIYITAAGVFELYLNGRKVGRDMLAPFFNDYSAYHQVCTYALDVQEENVLEIHVGKGWYMGRFGLDHNTCNFGSKMAALAEIRLTHADGTETLIPTDSSWEAAPSDVLDSGIYDGETLDRRAYPTREYTPVQLLELHQKLTDRLSVPLAVNETVAVKEVIVTPKGETVLDFGQNFAGFVSFRADLPAGTKVKLDFGEILQDDCFYNDNYRTATPTFVYVSGGEPEVVRPHFTYYGFRYVRVEGMEVNPTDFTGNVLYSSMDRTGYLETGHQKINRLIENSLWSQRSNFFDLPTDCPQRDERLGWTGDIQVFAPTACHHMDIRAFMMKFCQDLREDQLRNNGGVPNFVPSFGMLSGACSVWGDVGTFLPEAMYRQYGDKKQLELTYPMMRDWVDYIHRCATENGNPYLYNFGFHFGDWVAQDGITPQSMKGGTDDGFIASCYYSASAAIVSRAASVLGREADEKAYAQLSQQVKQAIYSEYFTASGRLAIDTQTGYIVAMRFGIYPSWEKLMEGFRTRLQKDCYRIRGGFVGAPRLCTTLAENGMGKLAYDFLFREDYPSWLYCVNLGATTIWERWNSVLPDGRISGIEMNSLNHYAYGSVVEFLYAHGAGLTPLEPGFCRARIAPMPDVRLGYLDCRYASVSGEYRIRWEIRKDGQLELKVTVPFGCQAELHLPGSDKVLTLEPGTYEYCYTPDTDYRRLYSFETRLEQLRPDPRAMAILKEYAPTFYGEIAAGDVEKGNMQLGVIPHLHFIPQDPARTMEAIEKVCALLAE